MYLSVYRHINNSKFCSPTFPAALPSRTMPNFRPPPFPERPPLAVGCPEEAEDVDDEPGLL